MTMQCNFQDFQAESAPVLSEADIQKRFNLAHTEAIKAVSAVYQQLQVRINLNFVKLKNLVAKNITLSPRHLSRISW